MVNGVRFGVVLTKFSLVHALCLTDAKLVSSVTNSHTNQFHLNHCIFHHFLYTMSSQPSKLRILLVGRGGRESAIAWKLNQSPLVEKIFVAPGNGGTAAGSDKVQNVNVPENDYPTLVEIAEKLDIDLVIPGPDVPIVEGIEGYFRAGWS